MLGSELAPKEVSARPIRRGPLGRDGAPRRPTTPGTGIRPACAARRHSAALGEGDDVLSAVEDGLPLLLERLRAFLGVLGHRDGDADLHLLLERLGGRATE